VPNGVLLRELPDGGHEFVLDDPALSALVVDGSVTLRFGRTDVVVSGLCTLRLDGVPLLLDPGSPDTLAPLLSCFPGSARWLWSGPDGRLTLVLMQGQRLEVPATGNRSTWTVGGMPAPVRRTG
jgi:hypothetical protein